MADVNKPLRDGLRQSSRFTDATHPPYETQVALTKRTRMRDYAGEGVNHLIILNDKWYQLAGSRAAEPAPARKTVGPSAAHSCIPNYTLLYNKLQGGYDVYQQQPKRHPRLKTG